MVDKDTVDLSEKFKQENIVLLLSINYYEVCCFALENQIQCFICPSQTMHGTENIHRQHREGDFVCEVKDHSSLH